MNACVWGFGGVIKWAGVDQAADVREHPQSKPPFVRDFGVEGAEFFVPESSVSQYRLSGIEGGESVACVVTATREVGGHWKMAVDAVQGMNAPSTAPVEEVCVVKGEGITTERITFTGGTDFAVECLSSRDLSLSQGLPEPQATPARGSFDR